MRDSLDIKISYSIDKEQLTNFILEIDDSFVPKLSNKISIPQYVEKLILKARFIIAISKTEIIGLIAYYNNDHITKSIYIPIIGVKSGYRKNGIGQIMLESLTSKAWRDGFEVIRIQTWNSSNATALYLKNGFKIVDKVFDRPNDMATLKMELWK